MSLDVSSLIPMTTSYMAKRRRVAGKAVVVDKEKGLRSLVLPWSMMILVSIVAAVVLYPKETEGYYESITASSSEEESLFSGLQRILDSREDHREHVHKHVFEEAHKPLFPLDTSDQIGFVFAVMGLMVAAGGGIGGGGILVPIYILVMGFSPKHAIPLSNITVLGGALANMALNVQKRHPMVDRPLVDWDLILVMEVSGSNYLRPTWTAMQPMYCTLSVSQLSSVDGNSPIKSFSMTVVLTAFNDRGCLDRCLSQ
jgi:hypothetical protein